MVEYAFKDIGTYLEFFKEIDEIYKTKESTLKAVISEIENKFAHLLEERPKKKDEFLIPQVPKIKKEIKDKSQSSRASRTSRRDPSVLSNDTFSLQQKSSLSVNDSEVIRRSSRIATKTKLKPSIASQTSSKSQNEVPNTFIASPSQIPIKIRRTDDEKTEKKDFQSCSGLEETLCPANMNPPLGSSTPTPCLATPEKKKKSLAENKTPENSTRIVKAESVKKKIEDFEKRAKGNLQAVKLPLKDTENKAVIASKTNSKISKATKEISNEDEKNNKESRTTKKNSKILQEIKPPNEKIMEAAEKKKAALKKAIEENKRKREERERKVAAQREAAEKEKQLAAMKLEKEKDEKSKLVQKLKDDKLKAEPLKKKQTGSLQVAPIDKKPEVSKLTKLKKTLLMQKQADKEVPQYNIDNVLEGDSSEDEDKPKKQVPSWATKKAREYPLNVQAWLNKKRTVYPWFYNKNLKYPKLEELFSIEVKTRPRTSSAFWNSKICFNESFPIF